MVDHKLNLHDTVKARDAMGKAGKDAETIKKQIILVLLDSKKLLRSLKEFSDKLQIKHLSNSIEATIRTIDIYLEDNAEIEAKKNAK